MNLLLTRPSVLAASLVTLTPCVFLEGATDDAPVALVYQIPVNRSVEVQVRQESTSTMESSVWYPVVGEVVVEDDEFAFDMEAESTTDIEITFTDRFGPLDDDGALASLERSFDSLGAASRSSSVTDGEEASQESEFTSPLIGRVVRFEWDAEDDSYSASFAAGEEHEPTGFGEALLASQAIDAFGDWYLPDADASEVEVGATWDAGVDAWHRTLDIGGDFWIGPEWDEPPTEEEIEARRSGRAQLRSGGDGEVLCTYAGMREVDGRALAVLEVVVDVTVESVVSEEHEQQDEEGHAVAIRETVTTGLHWTGEGEFLWDTEASLPDTLSLEMSLVATTWTVAVPAAEPEATGDAWREVWGTDTTVHYRFRCDE